MTGLFARSPSEAHLYMVLHPCDCGESDLPWTVHESLSTPDGPHSIYRGTCPACGAGREFTFAVPPDPVPPPAFGGDEPSRIISAEQFHALAQRAAAAVPTLAAAGQAWEAYEAASDAVEAIGEVLKFVPPGQDGVPGLSAPQFRRQALEDLRYRYREVQLARSREIETEPDGGMPDSIG